ncbi:site-specific integrase [Nonomuraea rosea]|uniref:tyrosine-type recombinase/integrase n=1 Tax=Nonomuraea rosea TaxID=638574 RepID=UPI0031EE2DA7
MARSTSAYPGWGDVVIFASCTAARIGEVSGVRTGDIDTGTWTWTLRRQTTPSPGGLVDKGTKGKRARKAPIIAEVRELVLRRMETTGEEPAARLFTGPRGGRITTAVLRDATHWDEVVANLGHEHLRRHDLRHTGLTRMADAGVPIHVLRKIAGHGSLTTTQRYLHPDLRAVTDAGTAPSVHLRPPRARVVPKWFPALVDQRQWMIDRWKRGKPVTLENTPIDGLCPTVGTTGFDLRPLDPQNVGVDVSARQTTYETEPNVRRPERCALT